MTMIWIALAVWSIAWLVIESSTMNTEKADPIDITDPDSEDKWGAM